MSKTHADYLRDIVQELDDIIAFTNEGEAAFMQDVKTQKAVIRSYEVVGEISKRLPDDFRERTVKLTGVNSSVSVIFLPITMS